MVGTRPTRLSKHQLGYILVAPALILIAFVSFYPFLTTIWYSLHSIRLNLPDSGQPFVGLKNYRLILTSERFLNSMVLTFLFGSTFVALQMVFGLFIAQVLNLDFPGRPLVRASVFVPWAMAMIITALLWQWMYNAVFGVVNAVLLRIGVLGRPIDWLGGTQVTVYFAVLVVDVWRNTPFIAIILLAGLQSIPAELFEAARIDGAGRMQCFFHITLPQLKHAILVALLFRSIDAIRAFDILYVLTQGGPGTSTEIGSLYSYRMFFQFLDFGRGSASTVILAIFTTLLSVFYLRTIRVENF